MVGGYERGNYERPSMPLRYPLIYTLVVLLYINYIVTPTITHALFSLSLMPKASCLLECPIPPTSMPNVVRPGSCPIFFLVKLGSLTLLSHDRVRIIHMNV